MKTMRVAATTGLLAVAAVAAAVTLGGEDEPSTKQAAVEGPAKPGGTLRVLWKEDVDHVDPAITYTAPGFQVAFATQRPLMSFKPVDPGRRCPTWRPRRRNQRRRHDRQGPAEAGGCGSRPPSIAR